MAVFTVEIISAGFPVTVCMCQEHADWILTHDYFVVSIKYTPMGMVAALRSLENAQAAKQLPPAAPADRPGKNHLWQWMLSLIRRYTRWGRS